MNYTIIFSGMSLVYILILFIIFKLKNYIKTTENKLYSALITSNLIGIVVELFGVIPISFNINWLIIPSMKAILLYFATWIVLFAMYIVSICYEKIKGDYIRNAIFALLIPFWIAIIALPTRLFNENKVTYSYGPSVDFVSVISLIAIILMLALLFINFKRVNKKKIIPLISFCFLGIGIIFIYSFIPGLLLITAGESVVTYLMYFTIENPDLKMLKEMEISKTQAEKANRAKTDFLSSMSHEMRTPLNAIVGLSEDITTYKENVPTEVYEDSLDIQNASHSLLEIVDNILDINMIESDSLKVNEIEYNFKDEIEKLCKITTTRIGDKDIKFNLSIDEDIPEILYGDSKKVKTIINNLLTNAIKYTDKGNIDLKIKCNNVNNICNLIISCKDTGKGIKKEYQKRLFTKFDRLDVEINSTTEGTGLGLAITKSLLELLKGKIRVESEESKGTIFTVEVKQKIIKSKITHKNVDNEIKEEIINNHNELKKQVLVVDDNKLNIKVAARTLQDFNFEIDEAISGFECLEKVKLKDYDLILMDIMMPEMSGEETIKELQKNKDFKIPVMAVTADAVVGAKEKYLDEGFVDYLPKPFTKEQMTEKINKILK